MNVKFNLGLSESDRPGLVLDVCLHVFLQFVLRGSARSPQEIEFIYIHTVGLRMDAWQSVWPELGKRSKRFFGSGECLPSARQSLGNRLAIAWQYCGNRSVFVAIAVSCHIRYVKRRALLIHRLLPIPAQVPFL